ncbi:uncharacterized protein BO88DRAFT_422211 [Aspergillus vadensis CBS 113365]|uniref:Uncharacterized protein n=1 Tax=Aspergillus vadensis (strain CBS 113365 / IMI 142717 / IBT 24658) TaxID=1448311 RepID=A0A319BQM9_ASPVC|nr:hypothetical protein BO88DRAFT_422211 [Aspergillus vadensis CBS 113365]PYH73969.1 hypothetical protein BO88DRAFT_422211 [Aspergillus vadensis CBS 113365]
MSRRRKQFDRLRVIGALALRQRHPRTERIKILVHRDDLRRSLLPLFLHFDSGFLARTAHCPRLIDPSSTPDSRVRLLEIAQTTSFVSI